ncbi:MAG: hypothetical protein QG574_4322 [Cyanobacteriota bacterium erpe_2018_sw_21hr_WHONDRS-SW48-000092_B_bin.40]|jgi:hypothetical protein|nr:hypothetical protein [Cyanobacteriota bacterium erpe_2018_sw_21hr_WHONDRS-SW48-000092_B_bin.40]
MTEPISELEAALLLGISPQLLKNFTQNCPKTGQTKLLQFVEERSGVLYFLKDNLVHYDAYLREKWPTREAATRAHIPDSVKSEIRRESRFGCAICQHTNNLEVAHIKSWKTSKCNHPHNLLLLCPNHHTQYDYGHKLHDCLKIEDVNAIKNEMIQASRYKYQMLLEPANSAIRLTKTIDNLNKALKQVDTDSALGLKTIAVELITASEAIETIDTGNASLNKANAKAASALKSARNQVNANLTQALEEVSQVASDYDELLDSLDGEECPHCNGRGKTGLVGDICVYCRGNGSVTVEELKEYDPDEIDKVECPRCAGRGTIGFRGEFCAYCKGSQVVSKEDVKNYDEDDFDEVDCPHCGGRGTIGLRGEFCSYCKGDCVVSTEDGQEYNRDEIDEVDCPHCQGNGQQFDGEMCKYCFGDTYVDQEKYDAYAKRFPDRV